MSTLILNEWITAHTKPQDVSFGVNGGDAPMITSPVGIVTMDAGFLSRCVSFDLTNAAGVIVDLDMAADFGLTLIDLANNPGSTAFTGSFEGVTIYVENFAELPILPVGCAKFIAMGATSSTTLYRSGPGPNRIEVSGLTSPGPITEVDHFHGSEFLPGAIDWNFYGMALTSEQTTYWAEQIRSNAYDLSLVNVNMAGGANSKPCRQVLSFNIQNPGSGYTDGDPILVNGIYCANVAGNGPISGFTLADPPIASATGTDDTVAVDGTGAGAVLAIDEIEEENFNIVAIRAAGGIFITN